MIPAGRYVVTVPRQSDTWPLYTIGDCHIGNAGCSVEHLAADVDRVASNPNARAVLMGDLADYVGPADRRWDAANITPSARVKDLADWGQYLAGMVVKTFKPIAKQIIGALSGNHESTFQARQAQQCHAWTCQELGVKDLGYSCFIDLAFRRACKSRSAASPNSRRYRLFCHHGAGAAATAGGKMNRLVSFMSANEADLFLVGHVHERDVKRLETLAANDTCTELTSRKKLGLFTGTYLRTYHVGENAGYGERAGYRPVPLGCSVVEFQPFGHDWKHREESVSARVAI